MLHPESGKVATLASVPGVTARAVRISALTAF